MEKVITEHIEITPGVCGGKPRITSTRIRVQDIVIWHDKMGISAEEIALQYGITLGEIHAALAYYFDHAEEIEEDLKKEDELIAAARARHPSKLGEKFGC